MAELPCTARSRKFWIWRIKRRKQAQTKRVEDYKDIQKKYCSRALIVTIIGAVILIVIGEKAIGKGLVLGTLFSILNFLIMGQMIPLRLANSQSKTRANAFSFISIFLRFPILAIPLILSLKLDSFDFIGVVIGLFMVQITILFHHLILNRLPDRGKVKTG